MCGNLNLIYTAIEFCNAFKNVESKAPTTNPSFLYIRSNAHESFNGKGQSNWFSSSSANIALTQAFVNGNAIDSIISKFTRCSVVTKLTKLRNKVWLWKFYKIFLLLFRHWNFYETNTQTETTSTWMSSDVVRNLKWIWTFTTAHGNFVFFFCNLEIGVRSFWIFQINQTICKPSISGPADRCCTMFHIQHQHEKFFFPCCCCCVFT